MSDDTLKTYARLARRRDDLRQKVAQVEKEMEAQSHHALVALDAHGGAYRAHGVRLTLEQDVRVKATSDTQGVVAACKQAKHPELVGVNWSGLISFVRARLADGKALPKAIDRVVRVSEGTKIGIRRETAKK